MQNSRTQQIPALMARPYSHQSQQLANTLHFFSGRVRAIWETKIFFSDHRNVAVVEVQDLYLSGKQATKNLISELETTLSKVTWRDAPEFHAYVTEYPQDAPPSWPFKLAGKKLWRAHHAWTGPFPSDALNNKCKMDVAYLPISYYTGKVLELFPDKIMYGDSRNNVMVNLENFYMNGKQVSYSELSRHLESSELLIHSYITKLNVIMANPLPGPELHLPTWPMGQYGSDVWVAWYAWQGEMPMSVKHKTDRYHIIRMNQWDAVKNVPLIRPIDWRTSRHLLNSPVKPPKVNMNGEATMHSVVPCSVSEGGETMVLKGGFLLGGENVALMTSYEDVIAFHKDVFYNNGQKLADDVSLSTFFRGKKIPLTALVGKFPKNKVLFNINVPCYAVCVFHGSPPQHYEDLKKNCSRQKWNFDFDTEETSSTTDVALTHFSGEIESLSFASGMMYSDVQDQEEGVSIYFKRKCVYLYGNKFHSSCSLLDKKQTLESTCWSVLAYPCSSRGTADFQAVAVWQFHYQNYMHLLPLIKSELEEISKNLNAASHSQLEPSNKNGYCLTGKIARLFANGGIIYSADIDGFVYFSKEVLYVHGELFNQEKSLYRLDEADRKTYFHMFAKHTSTKISSYDISMEATIAWVGKRPLIGSRTPKATSQKQQDYSSNGVKAMSPVQHEQDDCRNSMHIVQKETEIPLTGYLSEEYGNVVGKLLTTNGRECLLVTRKCLVLFSTEILYIEGKKYQEKDASLLKSLPKKGAVFSCAHLFPMINPKAIFNCVVKMEAPLVWVGSIPRCEPPDPPHGSFSKSGDKEGSPSLSGYLFLHGQLSAVGRNALLKCATPKGIIAVAVPSTTMLVGGRWLSSNTDIKNLIFQPANYEWSSLIYRIHPKEWCGETVMFQTAAVWEYGEHYNVMDKLQSVLEKFSEVEIKNACINSPRLTMNPNDELMFGWIVTVRNKWGVIRCTSETPNVYVYVKFEQSKVQSGKEKVGHRLPIGERLLLLCSLNAATIPEEEMYGFKVTMEASFVWLQSRLPGSGGRANGLANRDKDVKKVDGVQQAGVGKLVKSLVNSPVLNGSRVQSKTAENEKMHALEKEHKLINDDGTVNKEVKAKLTELGHKYIGKHVEGNIVKKCKGDGVGKWKTAIHGELYIKFSHENIYVDMCSLGKKFKVADLESRICHFYLLPAPQEEMAGYTVCLEATCGWIGTKPLAFPAIGKQPFSSITVPNLSPPMKSIISVELSPSNINEAPDRNGNRVKMNSLSNGLEDVLPVVNGSSLITDYTHDPSGQTEGKGGSVWEDWERKSNHHRGKIIEVHSNVGRLETEDGSHHYFSRDHCYLYGVSLRNVELWHVLVQGDKVLYTGTELSPGTVRVVGVWVGSLSIASLSITSARLNDWCTKNLVPDGAREILVSQLQFQVS